MTRALLWESHHGPVRGDESDRPFRRGAQCPRTGQGNGVPLSAYRPPEEVADLAVRPSDMLVRCVHAVDPGVVTEGEWPTPRVADARIRTAQPAIASRTRAVSTNCSKRTMSPPRTTKWWATRMSIGLPVALLVAV